MTSARPQPERSAPSRLRFRRLCGLPVKAILVDERAAAVRAIEAA